MSRRSPSHATSAAGVPPPGLEPGSRIAVVAPASPFDRAGFEAGIARLSGRYDIRFDPAIFSRRGYLAGDDTRRLRELTTAIGDAEVDAIVAARGGYGSTRLLSGLDLAHITKAQKLLVGFSDVTALHAQWARAGVRSIHGPMMATLGHADEASLQRWIDAVEGRPPSAIEGLTGIRGGIAHGPIVGGNLAVLAALVGTPYAPPLRGAILLIEDVGERPYRVDRMLTTLRHAGWLDEIAGLVAGAFTDAPPGADGVDVREVLDEHLGMLQCPTVRGLPVGHGDDNLELPLGSPAILDANQGRLELLEPAVRRRSGFSGEFR